MEGKIIRPRAILVFGAPCSGKTTFCEKFANQFEVAFYDLEKMEEENNIDRNLALMILEQIAKTGHNLLIEGELDTEEDREEIRELLNNAGYETYLVWIQTDVSAIKARLKSRLKTISKAKAAYDQRIKNMEAPSEDESFIVISGKHTFQTQIKHVLSQLR